MKWCFVSLAIRWLQIKKHLYTPIRLTKCKKSDNVKCVAKMRSNGNIQTPAGVIHWNNHFENWRAWGYPTSQQFHSWVYGLQNCHSETNTIIHNHRKLQTQIPTVEWIGKQNMPLLAVVSVNSAAKCISVEKVKGTISLNTFSEKD